MQVLIIHLSKASIYLLIFYMTWYLFFRRETFYRYNRVFLLTAFISSILLPFLRLPFSPLFSYLFSRSQRPLTKGELVTNILGDQSTTTPFRIVIVRTEHWWDALFNDPLFLLQLLYGVVAGFLLLQLAFQLLRILLQIRRGPVQKEGSYRLLHDKRFATPFSFFRFIFLHPATYDGESLQHILLHEKAHVSQGHTWDTLLASCYCCICWFNPFAWLMKKALLLNLEYLADEAVLHQQVQEQAYQYSLLKIGVLNGRPPIVNGFGQSFIKNRIVMINKQPSAYRRKWKYLLSLPIGLLSIGLLAAAGPSSPEPGNKYLAELNGMMYGVITPRTSDKDLQEMKDYFSARRINFEVKNLKRNTTGLISEIGVLVALIGGGNAESNQKADPYEKGISTIFFYTDTIGERGIGGNGRSLRPEFPEALLNVARQESTTPLPVEKPFTSEDTLKRFLSMNIRYPRAALENNQVGIVKVQFTVSPDGNVSGIKALGEPPTMQALEDEVRRVLGLIRKFETGPGVTKPFTKELTIQFELSGPNNERIVPGRKLGAGRSDLIIVGYGKNMAKLR